MDNFICKWTQTNMSVQRQHQHLIHHVLSDTFFWAKTGTFCFFLFSLQVSSLGSDLLQTAALQKPFDWTPAARFDSHSMPAPAHSAPEALSNCLYPLQNEVAVLKGHKESPPLGHASAQTTAACGQKHMDGCSVNRFTAWLL